MITFKRIKIENYKAIRSAELVLSPGLYSIVGINNDGSYISNGAGKSTVVQAITLALYNKDFYGAPLDSISNRFTKKPYRITLDFTMADVDYTVVNDRKSKKMILTYDDKKLEGTTKVLAKLESILGMGYNTFKLTHFITGNTISQLTQNLSQPTLFNDILQVVELQQLDKELFGLLKDTKSKITSLDRDINSLETKVSLGKIKDRYNYGDLLADREAFAAKVKSTRSELEGKRSEIAPKLYELRKQKAEIKVYITELSEILRSGVCSVCGSILVDENTIADINKKLSKYEEDQLEVHREYDELNARWLPLEAELLNEARELESALMRVEKELEIAKDVSVLSPEDLSESSKILKETKQAIIEARQIESFLSLSRKEIKAGNVVKSMLDRFFELVQYKISEYTGLINMSNFSVSVTNDRLGMGIIIRQHVSGKLVDTPLETLSNGERTRLSLLVLISMLDAMRIVSNCETNYLVFDEASSSFDASGIKELELLFNHLKGLGQSCFIITHGREMDAVPFDYRLTMTKTEATSTAEVIPL